jgi:hypothetical protein
VRVPLPQPANEVQQSCDLQHVNEAVYAGMQSMLPMQMDRVDDWVSKP